MSTNPNDFLMGGGGQSAKFDRIGDTVTGVITVTPEVKQQTDFDTQKPLFWDNGDPRMQLVVTIATDLRDPAIEDDDGVRRLYVKAKLQQAVRDAVRTSGAKGLEVGGRLTVTFAGEGEPPRRGANAPKLYTAQYVPAADVALNSDAPGTTPDATAPTSITPAATPAAGPTAEDIQTAKTLIAAGLDDDAVAKSAPSLTPTVIAGLRNAAAA